MQLLRQHMEVHRRFPFRSGDKTDRLSGQFCGARIGAVPFQSQLRQHNVNRSADIQPSLRWPVLQETHDWQPDLSRPLYKTARTRPLPHRMRMRLRPRSNADHSSLAKEKSCACIRLKTNRRNGTFRIFCTWHSRRTCFE